MTLASQPIVTKGGFNAITGFPRRHCQAPRPSMVTHYKREALQAGGHFERQPLPREAPLSAVPLQARPFQASPLRARSPFKRGPFLRDPFKRGPFGREVLSREAPSSEAPSTARPLQRRILQTRGPFQARPLQTRGPSRLEALDNSPESASNMIGYWLSRGLTERQDAGR